MRRGHQPKKGHRGEEKASPQIIIWARLIGVEGGLESKRMEWSGRYKLILVVALAGLYRVASQ